MTIREVKGLVLPSIRIHRIDKGSLPFGIQTGGRKAILGNINPTNNRPILLPPFQNGQESQQTFIMVRLTNQLIRAKGRGTLKASSPRKFSVVLPFTIAWQSPYSINSSFLKGPQSFLVFPPLSSPSFSMAGRGIFKK